MNNVALFQLTLIIHGQVQGVFFRESTCNEARKLAVCGEVVNKPDGTVLVVAQGLRPALEQLRAWCSHGPKLANVTKVGEQWESINHFTFEQFTCPEHAEH